MRFCTLIEVNLQLYAVNYEVEGTSIIGMAFYADEYTDFSGIQNAFIDVHAADVRSASCI
jgi:hypothetical protein